MELRKWLKGVDKIGVLNLLWVPHYNHAPIMMIVIKKQLCLVHDGCLWIEEMIPITKMMIHRIMRLPHSGENPAMEFGKKASEHVVVEAMKEKFKIVKKPHGYTITIICDLAVKVVTQILVGKVMRKFRADEVLTPVIALVAQCTVSE